MMLGCGAVAAAMTKELPREGRCSDTQHLHLAGLLDSAAYAAVSVTRGRRPLLLRGCSTAAALLQQLSCSILGNAGRPSASPNSTWLQILLQTSVVVLQASAGSLLPVAFWKSAASHSVTFWMLHDGNIARQSLAVSNCSVECDTMHAD
jgi:hypothetical protein